MVVVCMQPPMIPASVATAMVALPSIAAARTLFGEQDPLGGHVYGDQAARLGVRGAEPLSENNLAGVLTLARQVLTRLP